MNWLKRLGEAVKIGGAVIPMFGPVIAALIPGDKDDKILVKATDALTDLNEIIKNAEVFGASLNLSGADKLKGAVPSIAQVVMRSAIMGGLPPGNRALFDEGIAELTSALVKLSNSRQD